MDAACLHAGGHDLGSRNGMSRERFAQQISGMRMPSALRELRSSVAMRGITKETEVAGATAICAANQRNK